MHNLLIFQIMMLNDSTSLVLEKLRSTSTGVTDITTMVRAAEVLTRFFVLFSSEVEDPFCT